MYTLYSFKRFFRKLHEHYKIFFGNKSVLSLTWLGVGLIIISIITFGSILQVWLTTLITGMISLFLGILKRSLDLTKTLSVRRHEVKPGFYKIDFCKKCGTFTILGYNDLCETCRAKEKVVEVTE